MHLFSQPITVCHWAHSTAAQTPCRPVPGKSRRKVTRQLHIDLLADKEALIAT